MSEMIPLVVHATHEAGVKVGGIGAVLDGLLGAESYNQQVERTILLADPFLPNPLSKSHHYVVSVDRAICSILLGIVTYDANLLVIRPADRHHEY